MKTFKNSITALAVLITGSCLSQTVKQPRDSVIEPTTVADLAKTFDNYLDDSKYFVTIKSPRQRFLGFTFRQIDSVIVKKAYNPKMLNMFIANSIGSYVTSSTDLSLQKYYAILESADGSFFLGTNVSWMRKNKIDRLKHISNFGLKAKAESNFATLFEDGKPSAELGLNLKHTYVFQGKVKYDKIHKENIANYRKFILSEMEANLKKYADTIINTELEATIKHTKVVIPDDATDKEKEAILKQFEEQKKELNQS